MRITVRQDVKTVIKLQKREEERSHRLVVSQGARSREEESSPRGVCPSRRGEESSPRGVFSSRRGEESSPRCVFFTSEKRRRVIASLCPQLLRRREESSPRGVINPGRRKRSHSLVVSLTREEEPSPRYSTYHPGTPPYHAGYTTVPCRVHLHDEAMTPLGMTRR